MRSKHCTGVGITGVGIAGVGIVGVGITGVGIAVCTRTTVFQVWSD